LAVFEGATRGECALNLPVQAVQEIAEQCARSRQQHRKVRLAWRRSFGARRSLGWIPFKVRTIRYNAGQVYFAGCWLSLWDSFGLKDFELRAGTFSEDARGRWYLNICVPRAQRSGGERNKPSVASILDRSIPSLGIDLGLREFAAFSDAGLPPVEAKRFYRDLEPKLAQAQRARKKPRTRRKDFLHKLSTRLVKANGAIFVGDVNASALAKTRQAKSVLDAGGVRLEPCFGINAMTQGYGSMKSMKRFPPRPATCVTAVQARKAWRVLESEDVCGAIHDRNVNSAHIILAAGYRRLAEGISVL
jgi:putative transposase